LPCHSLEDFPLHHQGEEAEGLLANWTALWHPALLASAAGVPRWQRVDNPPDRLANRLVLIPSVSTPDLPTGFVQRAAGEGACVIRRKRDRQEILRWTVNWPAISWRWDTVTSRFNSSPARCGTPATWTKSTFPSRPWRRRSSPCRVTPRRPASG
jgi:hypothetical protein